jgi:hypothetical protein
MTLLCEFVLAREMDGAVGTPNTRLLSLDLASPGLRSLAVSGLVLDVMDGRSWIPENKVITEN